MQISIHAEGPCASVRAGVHEQAERERDRVSVEADQHQTFSHWDHSEPNKPPKAVHRDTPLPSNDMVALLDAIEAAVTEQLDHVDDAAPCAVTVSVTVHRPDPT